MVAEFKKPEESFPTKGLRRPFLEIMEDFAKPVPRRFLKSKRLKNSEITFVPWYNYIKLLNFYSPGFQWSCQVKQIGERTVVEGRLTILAEEGSFSQMATGTEENDVDSYGDPSSNAEAMALRRCCAKFGLSLDLWAK